MAGGTTYYNQPGMHVTRASVPLAGTSHVYRVTEVLWAEAVEAVIESLLVGRSLHVCCGKSLIGDVRQDLYEPDADIQCDAADMSAHVADDGFDTVLCDPPYNGDLGWNHRLLKELTRVARQQCHPGRQNRTLQVFLRQCPLVGAALDADDVAPVLTRRPCQPDGAVAVGRADFQQPLAVAELHQDAEKVSSVWFQVEHSPAMLGLARVVRLSPRLHLRKHRFHHIFHWVTSFFVRNPHAGVLPE